MEDAHLSVSPMSNPKNSLFGVFDGHGGSFDFSQELRFPLMWNATSSRSWRPIRNTELANTKMPLGRPSSS